MLTNEELKYREYLIEQITRNKVLNLPTYCDDFQLDYKVDTDSLICTNYKKRRKRNSFKIPDLIDEIGHNCFSQMKQLEGIEFSKNLKVIGESAFHHDCYLYALDFNQCPDLYRIEKDAFYNCKYITSIDFEGQLSYIGDYAFYCCNSLNFINIKAPLKYLGENAFSYSTLKTVNIDSSENLGIGSCAFYCLDGRKPDININANSIIFYPNALLSMVGIKNLNLNSNRVIFYPNTVNALYCKNMTINGRDLDKEIIDELMMTQKVIMYENGIMSVV